MNMDDKKIDELINKALQEEQALPEGLSRRLEKQIDTWASTEEKKTRSLTRRRTLYWLSGVAASILLCISFLQYKSSYQAHDRLSDTYTNPKDAAAAAEKALLLLSQILNQSLRHTSIHTIHGHMISIISSPAQCQFLKHLSSLFRLIQIGRAHV